MKKLFIIFPFLFLFACHSNSDYNLLMLDSKKINEYSYSLDYDKDTFPRDVYDQEILLKPHVINALKNMKTRGFKYVYLVNQHPTKDELKSLFLQKNVAGRHTNDTIRFSFKVIGLKKQYQGYILDDLITALTRDVVDATARRQKYLQSSIMDNTILVNNY